MVGVRSPQKTGRRPIPGLVFPAVRGKFRPSRGGEASGPGAAAGVLGGLTEAAPAPVADPEAEDVGAREDAGVAAEALAVS